MNEGRKIKFVFILVAVFLLVSASGVYYFYQQKLQQQILQEYRGMITTYQAISKEEVDFEKANRDLESFLNQYAGKLPPREEGWTRVLWADTLSEIEPKKRTEILKAVANSSAYPVDIRATAINIIVDDYEINFINRNRLTQDIFSGSFENLLTTSNGDVTLAVRKLNEQSFNLYPNAVADFRIAKWYADELVKNPALPEQAKTEYHKLINQYIGFGDRTLAQYGDTFTPQRRALMYELRARVLYLSRGDPEEVDRLFKLALQALNTPSPDIFSIQELARIRFYYGVFLMRNKLSTPEQIQALLLPIYEYLATPQDAEKRNVRMVSFLIAARDAQVKNYPFTDFNKSDIENLQKFYPEFSALIEVLDLKEYLKDHPLEAYLSP